MYKLIILIILICILSYLIHINSCYKETYDNKNKIAVCMWYDKAIKDYGNIAKKINKIYCKKHKYDLIYSKKRLLPERHPSWECIPLLLNTLKTNKYDYVIWIDADACFNLKSTNTIENIINSNKDKDIIFSGDETTFIINSGFMIFKNSDISKQFCKNVINSHKRKECRKHFNVHAWEQSCIIDLYKNNIDNIKNHSVIIPYKILQIMPHRNKNKIENGIVIHYAGAAKQIRIQELNKIYKKL